MGKKVKKKKVMQGLQEMKRKFYYIGKLDRITACQNILNNTDILQSLVVKKNNVYWQKSSVTNYIRSYVHET